MRDVRAGRDPFAMSEIITGNGNFQADIAPDGDRVARRSSSGGKDNERLARAERGEPRHNKLFSHLTDDPRSAGDWS